MASLPTTPLVSSFRANSFYTSPPDTAISSPYRTPPVTYTAVSGSPPVSPVPSSPSSGTLSVWSGRSSTGGVSSASTYRSSSPPLSSPHRRSMIFSPPGTEFPGTEFSPRAPITISYSPSYGNSACDSYSSSPRSLPISPGYYASLDPVSLAPSTPPITPPITSIVSRSDPTRGSTNFEPSELSPLHSPGPLTSMSYASSYNDLTSPTRTRYSGSHFKLSHFSTRRYSSEAIHPMYSPDSSPLGTPPPSY